MNEVFADWQKILSDADFAHQKKSLIRYHELLSTF